MDASSVIRCERRNRPGKDKDAFSWILRKVLIHQIVYFPVICSHPSEFQNFPMGFGCVRDCLAAFATYRIVSRAQEQCLTAARPSSQRHWSVLGSVPFPFLVCLLSTHQNLLLALSVSCACPLRDYFLHVFLYLKVSVRCRWMLLRISVYFFSKCLF